MTIKTYRIRDVEGKKLVFSIATADELIKMNKRKDEIFNSVTNALHRSIDNQTSSVQLREV